MTDTNESNLGERLKTIVQVEKQLDDLMRVSKECLQELFKEKQISKVKMEESATIFRRHMNNIEAELNNQMHYLSNVCVGSTHQGSTFGCLQNANLSEVANAHLTNRLNELTQKYLPVNAEMDARVEEEEEKQRAEQSSAEQL